MKKKYIPIISNINNKKVKFLKSLSEVLISPHYNDNNEKTLKNNKSDAKINSSKIFLPKIKTNKNYKNHIILLNNAFNSQTINNSKLSSNCFISKKPLESKKFKTKKIMKKNKSNLNIYNICLKNDYQKLIRNIRYYNLNTNSKLSHNNKIGTKDCYKIKYIKEDKQIKIYKISSTIFEHQSHSLLYLPKYNSIVLCSGHKQKNCEYLNLDKKEEPNNWKHLFPLRKSRENAIPLLFNEKYIFLIGGYDSEGRLNEDYDMLNYEVFINGKYQNYWKTYELNQKKSLLQRKGNGIIYYNNNIYILGGYNLNNDEFISWKINFTEDKDESILNNRGLNDKKYKIGSIELCDNINNNFRFKNKNSNNNLSFCFCGEQRFMKYKKFFVNISFGGQLAIIPNHLLD